MKLYTTNRFELFFATIIVGLVGLYFYSIFPHLHNLPKAPDDVTFFLTQFNKFNKEGNSIITLIEFLFKTEKQHIRLDGHIITLLSYLIFGNVNFKFILITGHLLFIPTIILLRKIFATVPLGLFCISCFAITIPAWSTVSWGVAVWGYNSYLFLVVLVGYLLSRNKNYSALIISFFTTFTIGTGGLIFALGLTKSAFIFYRQKNKESGVEFLVWMLTTFLAALSLYGLYIIDWLSLGLSSSEHNLSVKHISNSTVFFLFKATFGNQVTLTLLTGWISLLTLFSLIILSWRKLNSTDMIAIGILASFIGNAFVVSLTRAQSNYISPERYEIFSLYFLSFLFLTICLLLRKIQLLKSFFNRSIYTNILASLLLIPSTFIYSKKLVTSQKNLKRFDAFIQTLMLNTLVENKNERTLNISSSLESGLYLPPKALLDTVSEIRETPELKFILSQNMNTTLTEKIFTKINTDDFIFISGYAEPNDDALKISKILLKLKDVNTKLYEAEKRPLILTPNFRSYRKEIGVKIDNPNGYVFVIDKETRNLPSKNTLEGTIYYLNDDIVLSTYDLKIE